MNLFAPENPAQKNSITETSSARQFDPELSKAIQDTIVQIRANPTSMEETLSSLKGLNVAAQNLQKNDASGGQTITSNGRSIGANVEGMQMEPSNQGELFEKQMRYREEQEREALRVASMVIRQLEELDPSLEIQSKKQTEVVKPSNAPEGQGQLLDHEKHQQLISDINKEMEKLGILIDPNKAFLESKITLGTEHKETLLTEQGEIRSWMKGAGLKLNAEEERVLTETLSGLQAQPQAQAALAQEEKLSSPIPNVKEQKPAPADRFAAALANRDLVEV